jgi:hypothetical protein
MSWNVVVSASATLISLVNMGHHIWKYEIVEI